MNNHYLILRVVTLTLLSALMSACGGGGGDEDDSSSGSRAFTDPLFSDQWHLQNMGQSTPFSVAANAGIDINVVDAWNQCADETCLGRGVNIGIIDNGMELTHPDLQNAIHPTIQSFDYISDVAGRSPPQPTSSNRPSAHGTSVAGIIAAQPNGIGGVGIAPSAKIIAYNPINPTPVSIAALDNDIADALTRDRTTIHIYNNSWGDNDTDLSIHPARSTITHALATTATSGNQGRGALIVFASGNGAAIKELSSYDGNLNTRHTIVVGGLNAMGTRAATTEYGANIWLTAPSGDGCNYPTRNQGIQQHSIITTDLSGDNGINYSTRPIGEELSDTSYTRCFGQSSAASPMVSGVAALMLSRNPALTSRDIRFLLARTAQKVDPSHVGWNTNDAGYDYNIEYGFGLVNAAEAVREALGFRSLPAIKSSVGTDSTTRSIRSDGSVTSSYVDINNSDINTLEWVEVTVSLSGGDQRTTGLTLTRFGSSIKIPLTQARTGCTSQCGIGTFTFGVAGFFGEAGDGEWILEAENLTGTGTTVTMNTVRVTVYGH